MHAVCLSASLFFWIYRFAQLALFIALLATSNLALLVPTKSFVLTTIYCTQAVWALILAASLHICWKKGTVLFSRCFVKLWMVVWIAAAPPLFVLQLCLYLPILQAIWLIQTIVASVYVIYALVSCLAPEKTQMNSSQFDQDRKTVSTAKAEEILQGSNTAAPL